MQTGRLTKELGVFIAALLLCAWWVGSVFVGRERPRPLPRLLAEPAPQRLAPYEVPLEPPLVHTGPVALEPQRNPFAAPDPWVDARPDPIAAPAGLAPETTLPLTVIDEYGRLVSKRAPLVRGLSSRTEAEEDAAGER